jgi:hypothetical protein
MNSAKSSLPVPVSPSSKILEFDFADFSAKERMFFMLTLSPIILLGEDAILALNNLFSITNLWWSIARLIVIAN